jgi:hypothetical protein
MSALTSSAAEKRRFALIAFAGFIAAALAFAPASVGSWLIKRSSPLTEIAGAEGTLWKGRLTGVTHGGVLIGDVDYRLAALPLLIGKAEIDVTSAGGALLGRGRVSLSPGGADFRDVDAAFNLGAIRQYTFFGVRYQGEARLKADRLKLSRKVCLAEAATVSTSAFEALTQRWSAEPFPLEGAIACEAGAMIATLDGASADGKASIGLTVRPDYTYAVRIAAEPKRQDVSQALQFFGFENKGDRLSYEAAGVLKGLSS